MCWSLACALLTGGSGGAAAQVQAEGEGWVQAFSELRLRPGFSDPRATLADRLALARALGRHGPQRDAVAALIAGLEQDPPPVLRDELLIALARRAAPEASEPLRALLARKERSPGSLALALGSANDAPTRAALVQALPSEASAKVAEEALLRIGAAAVPQLVAALDSPERALSAARVLAALGARGAAARIPLERALNAAAPELRAAAAAAIGAIAAHASAPALAARLRDDPAVVEAALGALAKVASEEQGALLERTLAAASAERRPLVLRALAQASPRRAAPALANALRASDAAERVAALDVLLGEQPDASWIALLVAQLNGEHPAAAASALARIADGAGVPALLRAARSTSAGARTAGTEALARALAIGVRRFGDALDGDVHDGALALLRGLPKGERRLLLRALARDEAVREEIAAALRAREAELRASAAAAARMLGDEALAAPVRSALLRERDPEAVRRLCEAAQALGAELSWRELEPWLEHSETAPEAAALAAARLRGEPPRELRVALRRLLDPGRAARVRVGAALALGALREASAWPALVAALDDPAARVRLAAVHALARIAGAQAERALREHARIERDPSVREPALAALAHDEGDDEESRGLVLEARVRTDAGALRERPLLDVLLADGRWLRMRTLPGGELLLEDLAAGHADLRVVP